MNSLSLSSWLVAPQRRLRIGGLLALLATSSFMTPLSLDMYTPAVPSMTEHFDTSDTLVNLTLTGFYFCFTVGMLLLGPASDRIGRRWAFIASYSLYTLGSLLCALAPTIEVLITARLVQGIGAGGATAVGTAVIKDAFAPAHRERVLSVMQVLFLIGPVVAPLIGAGIISFSSWRMTFVALAVIGALALAASIAFEETITEESRVRGSVGQLVRRLVKVARNSGFTVFLVITSILDLCFMAYVAVASYVYIDFFGLSEIAYSLYFSIAALVTAVGPFLYAVISKRTSAKRFTTAVYAIGIAGGVLLIVFGGINPVLFCLLALVVPMIQSCVRPYSVNILLDQHSTDTGSASALINFFHGAIGSIGMAFAVLPWTSLIVGLGVITTAFMAVGLTMWAALMRSRIPLKGIKGSDRTSL